MTDITDNPQVALASEAVIAALLDQYIHNSVISLAGNYILAGLTIPVIADILFKKTQPFGHVLCITPYH